MKKELRVGIDIPPLVHDVVRITNFIMMFSRPSYSLLAQVYSLFIDGEQQQWEKIIDEVVRICVTVEQESPKYVFHIATVDADLQGVLDAYISVPGE